MYQFNDISDFRVIWESKLTVSSLTFACHSASTVGAGSFHEQSRGEVNLTRNIYSENFAAHEKAWKVQSHQEVIHRTEESWKAYALSVRTRRMSYTDNIIERTSLGRQKKKTNKQKTGNRLNNIVDTAYTVQSFPEPISVFSPDQTKLSAVFTRTYASANELAKRRN